MGGAFGEGGERVLVRICFLIRSLEPGGAERQLVTLVRALKERGEEVAVLVFYPGGGLEGELKEAGVELISLDKKGRWEVASFLWRLWRQIRRLRPDILHGYLVMPNLLAVLLKPLSPGLKVVWGVRASNMDLSRYDWLARLEFWLSRFLARFADLILVNSWAGMEYHRQKGYPERKMVVVPNGIDTDRFRPHPEGRERVRAEWGVGKEEKLIGICARLDPMKDHPTFLRAAALLGRTRKDVRFVCVGDGPEPYSRELKGLAEELGVAGRLIWAGSRKDMTAVYSALDIATSSSFSEGFSNAIAEAMACGVPCVVTDVGDSARIVGEAGVVVPAGDPAALAAAWTKILDLPEEERIKVSLTSRERVAKEFSVKVMVEKTNEALLSLKGGEVKCDASVSEEIG